MGIWHKRVARWLTRRLPWRKSKAINAVAASQLWLWLREQISQQLHVPAEQITLQSHLVEDLGMDSLESIELVMALEETCGFEMPDEDVETLTTVHDLLTYLERRTATSAPAP